MTDDVKLDLSPSAALIAEAKAVVTVVDGRGRAIVLKKPGVLAQYRLVEMIGGVAAKNEVYMNMILPLTYVESIDGASAPTLTKPQLEALIQRLDEDGINAVMKGVEANFAAAADTESEVAALKNS